MILYREIANTVGICMFLFCQVSLSGQSPPKENTDSSVPFVACKSDGQTGPLDAPAGNLPALNIDARDGQQLAYYKAQDGPGVLAPRGWNCFGTYGSDGSELYVTPQPIDNDALFNPRWKQFDGPFVEIISLEGETSGRYGIAKTIARLFPAHQAFVREVIKMMHEPASEYPKRRFPKDKLTYKSPELVEYVTPSQSEGEGTQYRLKKNGDSIYGAAILVGTTPDLIVVNVRLSPESLQVATAIVVQAEREAIDKAQ